MKKKSKKKQPIQIQTDDSSPTSTFFLSFVGEYVEVVCKGLITMSEAGSMPLVISGYLLDVDDKYLYLSDDMQSVSRAIKKEDYALIEIVKTTSEAAEALQNLSVPNNKEDGN